MSHVTVGLIPRERFSLAAESVQSILDYSDIPFNLIVVDCNMPEVFRQPIERMLSGKDNVKIIRKEQYLLPNQSRNLVLQEARDEFICFVENDNLVGEGWLSRFRAAIQEHDADVVIPLVMEGRPGRDKVHFDNALGRVGEVHTPEGVRLEVLPRARRREDGGTPRSRSEQFMETHCLFFRREVFGRIGPFDEEINTSEEVDLSLALYNAGGRAVFVPECVVHFIQPPSPVCADDRGFFVKKWDIEQARRSHRRIREKWNLIRMPQVLGFVEERNRRGSGTLQLWRDELAGLVAADETLIVVDNQGWEGSEAVEGLRYLPFLERDGRYWGNPSDDENAIQELDRMRRSGASVIAFAWHAFWWFDHYGKFYDHVSSRFRRVLENDHVVAFDLRL